MNRPTNENRSRSFLHFHRVFLSPSSSSSSSQHWTKRKTTMNAMQKDLGWENVHLFVQGETSVIGFDERRACFYRLGSLNVFSSPADLLVEEFQLETKISERVLRLFLNRNETILTVETNDNLYFVSLPKTPWKSNDERTSFGEESRSSSLEVFV